MSDAIWAWADRFSDAMQRRDDISRLSQQIRNAETQCGSCADWMTGACPREQHSNKTGRSIGPSSLSIKCQQFRMTSHSERDLQAARLKLAELVKEQP